MAPTQTNPTATPTDSPPTPKAKAPAKPKGKRMPRRGIRKRVLGEGEGDHCIYMVAGQNSELPQGSLTPIPNVPRFSSTVEAMRWIRNDSGDLLAGMQLMIFQAKELMNISVVNKPTVQIDMKPKVVINDPLNEKADG